MKSDTTIRILALSALHTRRHARPRLAGLEVLVLLLVSAQEGQCVAEVANRAGLGMAEASKAIRRLELHGLLSSRVVPTERRRKEIRLTAAGGAYIERLVAATRARRFDSALST
jgi:DNA-binding MarR family transcriptional regulator